MVTALRPGALALATLNLLYFAAPADAQLRRPQPRAEDCVLDRCGDEQRPGVGQPANPRRNAPDAGDAAKEPEAGGSRFRRGPSAASGRFDFYVLALSWSSGFCATNERGGERGQCRVGSNLGFVVHGLWPQYERGFPSNCDPAARPPTRAAMETARDLFPDEGLARHEWRTHGTCSGKSATDYFADVKFAHERVKIPKEFEDLRREERIAPSDVTRAFEAANPRLRPGMMAVGCNRGVLQEVRICMSKDLREFRPCPEVARNSCRSREVRIPPIR